MAPGPPELFRFGLEQAAREHLQRLLANWAIIADLCFSDLLLFLPFDVDDEGLQRFVILSQIRPTTSQTLHPSDLVGEVRNEAQRPLVAGAFRSGQIVDGQVDSVALQMMVQVRSTPIRFRNRVIGVMSAERSPTGRAQHGELERAYLGVFDRLARMIASGDFPFEEAVVAEGSPRVGDGVVVLDALGRAEYASPNAVSALHRAGIHTQLLGSRLEDAGLQMAVVDQALRSRQPAAEEVEVDRSTTLLLRCIPLVEDATVTGGVLLLRDISELRRRDRMLLSKDAMIREIHHRVKNNLQTISSLLRLQGRRLDEPAAKAAIEESARRIRTIALVHETLSREPVGGVPFMEIVRPLVRMVEEGLVSPEQPVRFVVEGDPGRLPATVATSLAVVLTELLQNVVDHAFPDREAGPGEAAQVVVRLHDEGELVTCTVTDNGVGLPDGFSLESTTSLGLSIVRTLVTTEMAGTFELRSAPGGRGTEAALSVPAGVVEEELA